MKAIGIFALLLGSIVLLVATYLSLSHQQFVIQPYALGIAAVLAGFLCIRKSSEA